MYCVEVRDGDRWRCVTDATLAERNYRVFAMLADVRNEWAIEPIAALRGVPPDVAIESVYRLGGPRKLRSWVSLRELLDYRWSEPLAIRVACTSADAERFRATGDEPRGYSWGTSEHDLRWIADPEVIEIRKSHGAWAGRFFSETIPWLAGLGAPDDVRLILRFSD